MSRFLRSSLKNGHFSETINPKIQSYIISVSLTPTFLNYSWIIMVGRLYCFVLILKFYSYFVFFQITLQIDSFSTVENPNFFIYFSVSIFILFSEVFQRCSILKITKNFKYTSAVTILGNHAHKTSFSFIIIIF